MSDEPVPAADADNSNDDTAAVDQAVQFLLQHAPSLPAAVLKQYNDAVQTLRTRFVYISQRCRYTLLLFAFVFGTAVSSHSSPLTFSHFLCHCPTSIMVCASFCDFALHFYSCASFCDFALQFASRASFCDSALNFDSRA
jgi:hypothetical protein